MKTSSAILALFLMNTTGAHSLDMGSLSQIKQKASNDALQLAGSPLA